jgi:hypothetical protein
MEWSADQHPHRCFLKGKFHHSAQLSSQRSQLSVCSHTCYCLLTSHHFTRPWRVADAVCCCSDWKGSREFFPFWRVHNAHGDLCDGSISVSDDRLMLTTNNAHACGLWVSCDPWLLGCSVLFSCCEKVHDLVFPCGETAPHGPCAAAGGSARQTVTTPVAHSKRCDDDAVAHDLVMVATS